MPQYIIQESAAPSGDSCSINNHAVYIIEKKKAVVDKSTPLSTTAFFLALSAFLLRYLTVLEKKVKNKTLNNYTHFNSCGRNCQFKYGEKCVP